MTAIAFFNNTGRVGKTSLVYHLAWMYQHLGLRVVAADLDPQANLTSMFLPDDRLEEVWSDGDHALSVQGVVRPIMKGTGDIADPHVEAVADGIGLIIGDLGLSQFEDKLSDAWPRCLDRDEAAFRTTSAFYRMLRRAAESESADLVLIDVGPNLGAINRAVLIAADHVVIPLAPDLFSLQGLRNLGPTLQRWRQEWGDRLSRNPDPDLILPAGKMEPAGYVIMQHAVRLDRPARAYERWARRIPEQYAESVLGLSGDHDLSAETDPRRLATIKHYRSLMPMAQEARKPMFDLKPADGAIGAHAQNVQAAYRNFEDLALAIAHRVGAPVAA